MRALLQRVQWAEVDVAGQCVGRIDHGLLVYLGVAVSDSPEISIRLAEKVAGLRIFEDADGKLNRSVGDVGGGILTISNFTLLADARKGRRPSFTAAAAAGPAEPLVDAFIAELRRLGCIVACGQFRADMHIRSEADGPVNILIDWPANGAAPAESSPPPIPPSQDNPTAS